MVPDEPARDPMSEASLVADLQWLTHRDRSGRGSRSGDARITARWLADELTAAGYTPVLQPIDSVPGQSNVIAELGPKTGKAIVVVAHYDHLGVVGGAMHPGADDNASGVVVALAVARELRRAPSARVVFLFTGAEEEGLAGAKAYLAAPSVPVAEIRAVYNLDMVGRNFFASSVNEEAKLAAVGLSDDPDLSDIATTAATEAGLSLLSVRPGFLKMVGEARRTDDWIFRDAGVLAIHFSTGLNDDYHRPTDTEDKVSRPQLVRMAKFVRGLVIRTTDTASWN